MAKLEIELSEYDAMREAKKAAEARVEELKQENQELKASAKVVLRRETKYLVSNFSTSELEEAIRNRVSIQLSRSRIHSQAFSRHIPDPFELDASASPMIAPENLVGICLDALRSVPKKYTTASPSDVNLPYKSDTLIGFEDIRQKVEDQFKEQFEREHQEAMDGLEKQRASYIEKEKDLSSKLASEYEDKYRAKINLLEEKCKEKDEENIKLLKQISELSKSQEQKVREAEEKVREAEEELARVKGKKSFWRR